MYRTWLVDALRLRTRKAGHSLVCSFMVGTIAFLYKYFSQGNATGTSCRTCRPVSCKLIYIKETAGTNFSPMGISSQRLVKDSGFDRWHTPSVKPILAISRSNLLLLNNSWSQNYLPITKIEEYGLFVFKNLSTKKNICVCLLFLFSSGECWSGDNGLNTFAMDGPTQSCTDQCYEPCKPYSKLCVGQNFANFVYKISKSKEIPF